MDLKTHYNDMYQNSISKINSDRYEIDRYIDSNNDNRFGLTLIARPDHKVLQKIENFQSDIHAIDPYQYYYPNTDFHVTVLSIISCFEGFKLNQILTKDYIELIENNLNEIEPFNIEFRGLTASPSCIMVQGFLKNNTLNQIRDRLRLNFKNSKLKQSIDSRYTLQTAHSTIIRFKSKLIQKERFLEKINEYRDFYFGTFRVERLELVYNDWYHRTENVQQIHNFKLK